LTSDDGAGHLEVDPMLDTSTAPPGPRLGSRFAAQASVCATHVASLSLRIVQHERRSLVLAAMSGCELLIGDALDVSLANGVDRGQDGSTTPPNADGATPPGEDVGHTTNDATIDETSVGDGSAEAGINDLGQSTGYSTNSFDGSQPPSTDHVTDDDETAAATIRPQGCLSTRPKESARSG
jgi:hypothetical protein